MIDRTTIPDSATVQYRGPEDDVWTTLTHPDIEGGVTVGDLRERDLWPDVPRMMAATVHNVRFMVDAGPVLGDEVDAFAYIGGGDE